MSLKSKIAVANPFHRTTVADLDDPITSAINGLEALIQERRDSIQAGYDRMTSVNEKHEAEVDRLTTRISRLNAKARADIAAADQEIGEDKAEIASAAKRVAALKVLVG
jgi:uncharacterized sporulation protein YeaH/YhbH (DUF444 family)